MKDDSTLLSFFVHASSWFRLEPDGCGKNEVMIVIADYGMFSEEVLKRGSS
jgi:hypothetical protein